MEPSFVVDLLDKVAKVFGDHFEGFEDQSDICARDRLKYAAGVPFNCRAFSHSRGTESGLLFHPLVARGVDKAHVLINAFFRCGPGRD